MDPEIRPNCGRKKEQDVWECEEEEEGSEIRVGAAVRSDEV